MLVRVDEVVVCGVVEEDEAEADGEAAQAGTNPVDAWVRRPGEDEETDGDEPAGDHHWYQSRFRRREAAMFSAEVFVVSVDERRSGGAEDHTEGDRDEHETCDAGAVAFASLIDNRISGRDGQLLVGSGVYDQATHAMKNMYNSP